MLSYKTKIILRRLTNRFIKRKPLLCDVNVGDVIFYVNVYLPFNVFACQVKEIIFERYFFHIRLFIPKGAEDEIPELLSIPINAAKSDTFNNFSLLFENATKIRSSSICEHNRGVKENIERWTRNKYNDSLTWSWYACYTT